MAGRSAAWIRARSPGAGCWPGTCASPRAGSRQAAGCELFIHTAAVVSNAVPFACQWQVNVLGTRRAIDAALTAGAARLPGDAAMRGWIAADQARMARRFVRSERHTMQVDFWRYARALKRCRASGAQERAGLPAMG